MAKNFKIAIAGLGVVGGSVIKILNQNAPDILARTGGVPIEIVAISARNKAKAKLLNITNFDKIYYDDPIIMAKQADYDCLIEVIGGVEGVAPEIWHQAILRKKQIITANKALLAEKGEYFLKLANKYNSSIKYEASVAGGIPIIKIIKEGLAGTKITKIQAILNGTCNYILSRMYDERQELPIILKDAQAKGYAEAEPTLDIGGFDAGHKLTILINLAFGGWINAKKMPIFGITNIKIDDINFAGEFGYRIKLIASAEQTIHGISLSVEPVLLNQNDELANTNDVYNAIKCYDDLNEKIFIKGRGAGAGPTGLAVVADIVDMIKFHDKQVFNKPLRQIKPMKTIARQATISTWYIRLVVIDKTGVLAGISKIFHKYGISIEKLLQNGRQENLPVSIIFITHAVEFGKLAKACQEIQKMDFVLDEPCIIKVAE